MAASMVLSLFCVAFTSDGSPPSPDRPGRAASEAQVKMALASEAKGQESERLAHLARAIALDPGNALARGLMGLVEYQGRWKRPEAVGAKLQEDPAQAGRVREYLTKRAQTPMKADAQVQLAEWCEQHGLKEQAQAHYRAALRQDPSKELAWKRLGYKKLGGRWMKPEEAAAAKAEADAQRKADKEWRPRLDRIRDGLISREAARREKAEKDLTAVRAPRAVPAILAVLATGNERLQLAAVRVLGQLEGPSASIALADLSIFSESAAVRQVASSALLTRDPRDVIGRLVGMIRRPFKYKVIPDNGPGTTAQLLVDGEAFNVQKLYVFPTLDVRLIPTEYRVTTGVIVDNRSPSEIGTAAGEQLLKNAQAKKIDVDMLGALNRSRAEAAPSWNAMMLQAARQETLRQNAAVGQGLEGDVRAIEAANDEIERVDGRVLPILRSLTGQELGREPEAWNRWWTDQLGYASPPSTPDKPTFTDTVGSESVAVGLQLPRMTYALETIVAHSCFAGGTPVRTIDGPKAIESIAVGDLVLSQDTATGVISFRPVTAIHHNAPAATLRLRIGGEEIVATGIHRFWKSGHGWTMARDLKPGDRVRMVGASAAVESVTPDVVQPVYNLEVEGNPDFFVGQGGALVHDNSFVRPVEAPFDGLAAR